jgi:dTDP-4-dehydrorhamnose 3,5-epimerase
MQVTPTAIPDVLLLQPQRHDDERGFVIERWQRQALDDAVGRAVVFVQHNQSRSRRGVLRGLHYQLGSPPQGKLVWAAQGCVFDVAVDLRRGSATFGRWVGAELSADNRCQLWIPPGFAHGFYVLSESADVDYKLTASFDPAQQQYLRWDDAGVGIAWPTGGTTPLLSPRDAAAPGLHGIELP